MFSFGYLSFIRYKFAKIFSCFVDCHFTFFMMSFEMQNYILVMPNWSVFYYCLCLWDHFKKPLPNQGHEDFCLFSFKCFIVLAITFSCFFFLIPFGLTFIYGVR